MEILFSLIGLSGLITLLMSFLLQAIGIFDAKKPTFYILNAVGAGALASYAFNSGIVLFAVLETFWCLAAFVSLGKMRKRNHQTTENVKE